MPAGTLACQGVAWPTLPHWWIAPAAITQQPASRIHLCPHSNQPRRPHPPLHLVQRPDQESRRQVSSGAGAPGGAPAPAPAPKHRRHVIGRLPQPQRQLLPQRGSVVAAVGVGAPCGTPGLLGGKYFCSLTCASL